MYLQANKSISAGSYTCLRSERQQENTLIIINYYVYDTDNY